MAGDEGGGRGVQATLRTPCASACALRWQRRYRRGPRAELGLLLSVAGRVGRGSLYALGLKGTATVGRGGGEGKELRVKVGAPTVRAAPLSGARAWAVKDAATRTGRSRVQRRGHTQGPGLVPGGRGVWALGGGGVLEWTAQARRPFLCRSGPHCRGPSVAGWQCRSVTPSQAESRTPHTVHPPPCARCSSPPCARLTACPHPLRAFLVATG